MQSTYQQRVARYAARVSATAWKNTTKRLYRVERAFKDIPHIIQSALNVVQQVSEGESWHQLLMKIVNEAQKPRCKQ